MALVSTKRAKCSSASLERFSSKKLKTVLAVSSVSLEEATVLIETCLIPHRFLQLLCESQLLSCTPLFGITSKYYCSSGRPFVFYFWHSLSQIRQFFLQFAVMFTYHLCVLFTTSPSIFDFFEVDMIQIAIFFSTLKCGNNA